MRAFSSWLTLARIAAWSLGLAPALLLWLHWREDQFGANPVELLEHHTGLWALRILIATLAMTPLRQLTGRGEFIQVRRLLGLWAFAWACTHIGIYVYFDLGFSLKLLLEDIVKRTYITIGFIAWLLLLPLAITSTRGWQRRLKRRWKQLHWAIYPATALACLHFWWLVKSDVREPLIYVAAYALLMAARLPLRRILRGPFSRTPAQ